MLAMKTVQHASSQVSAKSSNARHMGFIKTMQPAGRVAAQQAKQTSARPLHARFRAGRLCSRQLLPPICSSSGASGPGMNSALVESMRVKIGEALEAQSVEVTDMYGDGRHVSIEVVSASFEGKSSMQRQRMVYKAIWFELQEAVHAVDSMTTKTPEEL